jgi:NADH-quinone oxidoreductase subunit F
MFLPLLTKNFHLGHAASLKEYEASGGYQGLKASLKLTPDDVIKTVIDSGLRGRGGAGFPTGKKWSLTDRKSPGQRYFLVNADEMEPGTFKDRFLMENDPHQLVEGLLISGYATQAGKGYIFIRYEYIEAARALVKAIEEARGAGYIGENILGSGFSMEVTVHRSAGRYECGEETALMNALEGKRANPRSKPPYPASKGFCMRPTTINNVETVANIPHIINMGGSGWKTVAAYEGGAGTKLYGISGRIKRPGLFELPTGPTLREIIETHAGGMQDGYSLKACLPGGASTPFITPEHLDVRMDFDTVSKIGSRMGTGCVTVFDNTHCIVRAMINNMMFFVRESCGWCTPCRDGLPFVYNILQRIEAGVAEMDELAVLEENCETIYPNSFCAFAPGAVDPVKSMLKLFRPEVEEHIRSGKCPIGTPSPPTPSPGGRGGL